MKNAHVRPCFNVHCTKLNDTHSEAASIQYMLSIITNLKLFLSQMTLEGATKGIFKGEIHKKNNDVYETFMIFCSHHCAAVTGL